MRPSRTPSFGSTNNPNLKHRHQQSSSNSPTNSNFQGFHPSHLRDKPMSSGSPTSQQQLISSASSVGSQQQQNPEQSSSSTPNNNNVTKKGIACSKGTPKEFFQMFFLSVSRKYLGLKAEYKLIGYFLVVFIGSIFAELFTMPKDIYAVNKISGTVNVFIQKFGYGWIFVIVAPFIFLTARRHLTMSSSKNSGGYALVMAQLIGRLVLNTLCWFVATSGFFWYYASKGMCFVPQRSNETHTAVKQLIFHDCRRQGYQWQGFDISGHTFLLIFCNFILLEEARVMKVLDKIFQQQQQSQQPLTISSTDQSAAGGESLPSSSQGDSSPSKTSKQQPAMSKVACLLAADRHLINFLLCLFAATAFVYDLMLLVTVLWYHRILEKMIALLFGAVCWYLTYRVSYPKLGIAPAQPPGNSNL